MISFWRRLLDLISPRLCVVCGHRLSVTEEAICSKCNFHLPRTGFHLNAYENEMARLFWAQVPIERATAFFYYEPHAQTANIIYELKYKNRPDIGIIIGRMLAKEVQTAGFFDGIDGIIAVPLAKKRQQQRGYNQSEEIAQGVSEITGLPILKKVVRRTVFEGSQTNKGRWERHDNVEHVFELIDTKAVSLCQGTLSGRRCPHQHSLPRFRQIIGILSFFTLLPFYFLTFLLTLQPNQR